VIRRGRGGIGETDLLALLQSVPEFAGDTFERVAKGAAGADVVQTVTIDGVRVGRIVFDAKNTKRWSGSWTTKLHQDAVKAEADHAVLVIAPTAFPSGENDLLYRDSVVVTTATRLIPIVLMMRKQTLRSHALKLSSQQRGEKGDRLLVMLTSNRVGDLWERHSDALRGLLDIERADEKHQGRTRGACR
jgi:hypothetical protein